MKRESGENLEIALASVLYSDDATYALKSDAELEAKIPSLTEMTKKAISLMEQNNEGFVLQVEGGKVDWAAHANDAAALIYDQIAFDEAVAAAIALLKAAMIRW